MRALSTPVAALIIACLLTKDAAAADAVDPIGTQHNCTSYSYPYRLHCGHTRWSGLVTARASTSRLRTRPDSDIQPVARIESRLHEAEATLVSSA